MDKLRLIFYCQPMDHVYIETAAMYIIWTVAMLLFRGKARVIISVIAAVLSFGLICLLTVHGRTRGDGNELSLIPFISFANAKIQPELYRSMYMNMLLFLPLGLSLPFALQGKIKHCVLISIAIGFLISVGVEAVQYLFCLGRCETDDVIMNTLGVLIGTTSFLLCSLAAKSRKSRGEG